MGRQRKPTSELDRRGAFDKNPERGRERANEPVVTDPLGDPPAEFLRKDSLHADRLLTAWKDLLSAAQEVKLTRADRIGFELAARLLVICRFGSPKSSDWNQLERFIAKFGLTPADRSRVQGHGKTAEEESDEWGELAEGKDGLPVQ
jgi:hypothetical protein